MSSLAACATFALLAASTHLSAQDRFGAAVALTGPEEVVVLKPGAAIGPAAAIVYRLGADGAWSLSTRLGKLAGGFPGEAVTEALSAGSGVLLIGGGDPAGSEAGHLYERTGEEWTPLMRVPLDPGAAGTGAALPEGGLDMATLSRLMGPPPRRAVLSASGRQMAVSGGALPAGVVHVLARDAEGWSLEGVVTAPSEGDGDDAASTSTGFGSAMAIANGRLLVGAPGEGPGGAVHVFESGGSGWVYATSFRSDSEQAGGVLGAAVALSPRGIEAFAGAPGRDAVVRLLRSSDGRWVRGDDVTPGGGDAASGADIPTEGGATRALEAGPRMAFGASIALDGGRLLVGAPLADDARGRAWVFERDEGIGWQVAHVLTPARSDAGSAGMGATIPGISNGPVDGFVRAGFGSAVAVRGNLVLVGAPGAFGSSGTAALYDLDAESDPTWLDPDPGLRAVHGAEPVRCAEGSAAGFDCEGVDLLAFIPLSELGGGPGEQVTDVWGWTDPETGREYALVGRTAGLAFVDITVPGAPRFVGLMPANPSHARDIKVYQDHAFLTGDGAGDHGLLVFDLTRLRGITGATFEPDARYDQVASAHNLVIDTESGFAYTVGTNTGAQSCGGGLHMIDIRNPVEPSFAGCFTDTEGLIWNGRTHDAQCTVYRGPDDNYFGRQICFASNETVMRIVDVTDKSAPRPISTASHPGTAYIHQGWLTEDHRYLYVNDELDEIVGTTDRTRTLIYDVAELDDPILIGEHLGPDAATDHNLYIAGSRAYLANYQAGFRVLDISDPEAPVEIGWFDTTPYGENPPGFGGGAWTAWPFFESGKVIVTSMNEGLFILRPQRPVT